MSEPLTLYQGWVWVQSQTACDQVEEEQALKHERPAAGHTLVIHRVV